MTVAAHPVFARVVGGELPLSPEEARHWLDAPDGADDATIIERVSTLYGGRAEDALWLAFGRTALALAFRLAGAGRDAGVALPSFQCDVVFKAARAVDGATNIYHLAPDLTPDEESLFDAAKRAAAVVTCPYFGSAAVEQRLAALGPRLRALANAPWVIEDRAMAFPAPVAAADAARRCDFIAYSLRKSYPVPDGAPLVACSDRARAELADWRQKGGTAATAAGRRALRLKVEAKLKRHAWISGRPVVDDPERNALKESRNSETLISTAESAGGAAALLVGSAASAAYMLGRDLARDGQAVRARARTLVEAFSDLPSGALPLDDCAGIAVPLLADDRESFRAAARARGVFLPAHWPRDKTVPVNAAVARWYAQEVSLPTMPARPAADVDYVIAQLSRRR